MVINKNKLYQIKNPLNIMRKKFWKEMIKQEK